MTRLALSEIVSLFESDAFQNPFTVLQLEEEWRGYREAHKGEFPPGFIGDKSKAMMRAYLKGVVNPMLKTVDVSHFQAIVNGVQDRVAAMPEPDYAAFKLSRDNPTYGEVQDVVNRILAEETTLTRLREETAHYQMLLRTAGEYFTALAKTVTRFLQDESVCPNSFARMSDRRAFAEVFTADLEAAAARIAQLRAVVTNLHDKVLEPRVAFYVRAVSAVRLLMKADEHERAFGNLTARGHTVPAGPAYDVSGFGRGFRNG